MKKMPFKITAKLATPFIMGKTRLTLDSLISAAIFRKTGLKGSECTPHIPLAQEHGIFKASSLFIDDDSRLSFVKQGRVMALRGPSDLSVEHFLPNAAKGDRYLSVDQARGRFKANMSDYTALSASAVCFYGIGNAEEVKNLIDTYITGIGVHANSGAGQILSTEVELLDDDNLSCWITGSGKPARPLPVELWKKLPGADSAAIEGAAKIAVRFPYWDADSLEYAVLPTEYNHF